MRKASAKDDEDRMRLTVVIPRQKVRALREVAKESERTVSGEVRYLIDQRLLEAEAA